MIVVFCFLLQEKKVNSPTIFSLAGSYEPSENAFPRGKVLGAVSASAFSKLSGKPGIWRAHIGLRPYGF